MMRRRSLAGALGLAMTLMLSLASVASAESILWSMTASPLAATTGVKTTYTLTATNEDPLGALLDENRIGCVEVTLPSNFSVSAAAVTGSNAGASWHVDSIVGNRVRVHVASGGDRLRLLNWVQFTVTATAFSTGSLAWTGRAYRDDNCGGTGALLGVPPIVVVTGPAVTPAPTPTATAAPTPTPIPTPRPTPTPTPLVTLPSLLPSLPLPSLSVPSLPPASSPRPTVTATPDVEPTARASGTPAATASPSAATSSDGPGATPAGGSGGFGPLVAPPDAGIEAPDTPELVFREPDGSLDIATVDIGVGIAVYAVPATALALPGVLILVWLALQTVGTIAWIPAVRRLRGRDDEPPFR